MGRYTEVAGRGRCDRAYAEVRPPSHFGDDEWTRDAEGENIRSVVWASSEACFVP